jgi:hypothetical protein
MKIESNFKILLPILVLISLNIFYIKVAHDIRKGTYSSTINYEEKLKREEIGLKTIIEENTSVLVNLRESNLENKSIIIKSNEEEKLSKSMKILNINLDLSVNSSVTTNNHTRSNYTDVVADMGQNINDGLNPLPIPSEPLRQINSKLEIRKEDNGGGQSHSDNPKIEIEMGTKAKSYPLKKSSHLFSFFSILVLTIIFAMIIISYQIHRDRKFEILRTPHSGYYLISD